MTKNEQLNKANQAFNELKSQPAIAQLSETSDFDEVHRLLKNFFDRYLTIFVINNPGHKWYLEDNFNDILKRRELRADVSEFQFVKTKVDSAIALITDLLKDAAKIN